MSNSPKRKTSNQELRTRKDLLQAASRLIKSGRKPTMDDVAAEALVSRATAYRHFRNVEALLAEAPVDAAITDPAELFAGDTSDDPEKRIDKAEAYMHEVTFRNEAQLRLMLAHSISRDPKDDRMPARQNRRTPLIEAALAPAKRQFKPAEYDRLVAALAMIFGTESMIVFRDVIGLDEKKARAVKSWAAKALVRAALNGK